MTCQRGRSDCGPVAIVAWTQEHLCQRCFDEMAEQVAIEAVRRAKRDRDEERIKQNPFGGGR